jgi:hypothetical protein
MANLAREDRGTDRAGTQAGKFDSISCVLARCLFCVDTLDVANMLCDGAIDRLQCFHDYRLEVNHFRSEHQHLDDQLHRRVGDRILRPSCVLYGKKRSIGDITYKQLSPARAYQMNLVS